MRLTDFENYIEDVIVERGLNYYKYGHVKEIIKQDKGRYNVKVVGSIPYSVAILIDGDTETIIDTFCDCPYDWGDYCKHQVATFFALREKLDTYSSELIEEVSINTNKKPSLKSILSNRSKEELINLIINLSTSYPEIERKLQYQYAPVKDEVIASKRLIKEFMIEYEDRGFIAWDHVDGALQGADMTLSRVKENIKQGNTKTAILLSITVLSSVVDMLSYSDDSSGFVGMRIDESLDLISEALSSGVKALSEQQKEMLFSILMNEAHHERYEGWTDWTLSLFRSCIYLCDSQERRRRIEEQLQNMLEEHSSQNPWFRNYLEEKVKLLQFELIKRFDHEEKTFQFIVDNLNHDVFREILVNDLLESEEYAEVIDLCQEVIADKRSQAHAKKWKEYQLQAYEGLANIEKQRELSLELLFKNEFDYYNYLKNLYEPNEWNGVLQEILEEFEQNSQLSSTYLKIIKAENMIDKILFYCKKNPSSIKDLYGYLINDYFEEVNDLFGEYIRFEAAEANDRRKYQKVCRIIKDYQRICGTRQAQVLINELVEKYKRRPAFLDELGKI